MDLNVNIVVCVPRPVLDGDFNAHSAWNSIREFLGVIDPLVGVPRREGGAAWAGPQGGGRARRLDWADGPFHKKEGKERKKKKKKKRNFPGIKNCTLVIFNWLQLFLGL